MIRPRVIPCLLLRNRGLVKTVKFKSPSYVGDPINCIKIFNDKEVDELVFLDIDATREGRRPEASLITDIARECFMPFAYGGGLRSIEDIKALLALGVEKAVINTAAVEQPGFVAEAARYFGSSTIVVSIDVKKKLLGGYEVCTRGGTKGTGLDPVAFARRVAEEGAGEILLTAIDREGTMSGYDLDLVRKVTGAVGVPVIAHGGAGSLDHMRAAIDEGKASAVAAGAMFVYHGKHRAVLINYPSPEKIEGLWKS